MCCTEGGSAFRGTVFRVALYFPHSAYVSSCKLVFAVYHGRRRRRRSVFRSVLCCSVFRFTSDRPKLRTRPSFSDQAPTVSKVQRITRCKTQFRFPTGQFRELREPHFLPERASLIAPLAHNSPLFSLSLSLYFFLFLLPPLCKPFPMPKLLLSNDRLSKVDRPRRMRVLRKRR